MARFVADLDAVRRHTGAGQIDLLGHSWGAHLALAYALAHPDRVDRLIYVSGTGIDPVSTWHGAYVENLRQRLGARLPAWEALERRDDRTPAEDRQHAVWQWTADFADPATALERAEALATPWLGINGDCSAAINAEVRQALSGAGVADVVAQCRLLDVPTLIVDGVDDIRPRWAVDSLRQALPRAWRVTLAGAGHLPWVEQPDAFRALVTRFLAEDVGPPAPQQSTLDSVG